MIQFAMEILFLVVDINLSDMVTKIINPKIQRISCMRPTEIDLISFSDLANKSFI